MVFEHIVACTIVIMGKEFGQIDTNYATGSNNKDGATISLVIDVLGVDRRNSPSFFTSVITHHHKTFS